MKNKNKFCHTPVATRTQAVPGASLQLSHHGAQLECHVLLCETVMLAEVRPEYVFKTIDPAVVPEEKSKPSRALICVLGTLLGGMLGVVIVLIRHFARSEPEA